MLEINSDKVCHIIVKAREYDAKVAVVEPDPGSNAPDDGMRGVLEDYSDDPIRDELAEFISGLNVDEQADLVALTWLGRGTYDDFDEAQAEAKRNAADNTAEYLLGIPLLADYLEGGLNAIGRNCDAFEYGRL